MAPSDRDWLCLVRNLTPVHIVEEYAVLGVLHRDAMVWVLGKEPLHQSVGGVEVFAEPVGELRIFV